MGVMREPTFLILAAVVPMPLHGYGIIQAVADLSAACGSGRARCMRHSTGSWARDPSSSTARRSSTAGCAATTASPAPASTLRRGVEHLEANASAARGQLHCAPTGAA